MEHRVFGYGSLLSHNSLSKTIPDRPLTPAIIKGFKRVFNLHIKDQSSPDVLNLEKNPDSICNGVFFSVNETELTKIKEREDDYNLEQTDAYDFLTGAKIGPCFVTIDYLVNLDPGRHLPDKHYFILCREAAYHLSRPFGEYWDKTTYLSDGELVADWLPTHPAYNTLANSSS